jgi:iron complex outermembrane receptor protein
VTGLRVSVSIIAAGAGGNVYITKSRGNVDSDQFSQELLLNGDALDNRLDWTVGGIYFNENALQNDKSAPLLYLTIPGGSPGNITIADSSNKSWGVFAQGTFALTDALSITAGARRSHDKRSFVAQAYSLRLTTPQVCTYTVANGLATLPIFSSPCSLSQSASFNQWSYTASVDYQLGQGKLVYARTGRGYRAGGFNGRVALPQVLGSFDPEIVTDYEVGLKADWLNRTLRTNIALFTSKSKDTQQTINGVSGVTSFTRTSNVGTRKVRGAEAEIAIVPSDNLSFDANFVYTTGKLVNPFTPDVTWLPETPSFTFGYGATLKGELSDALFGSMRVDLSYRDKMKSINVLRGPVSAGSPVNTLGPVVYVPRYEDRVLINARATLAHSRSGIELAVFGTNLLDESYAARIIGINGLGIGMETLGEPRVVGVELKVPVGAMR